MKFALAAIAGAMMLAACGGGGGGGSEPDAQQPPPPAASFDVSGVAAKGLLAGGIVTAHAIEADGSIRAEPLATASAPTDAAGHYTLHVTGDLARPYAIKVTVPAGGATHRDEVTGAQQALPAGFAMRALVVPAAAAITVNVTPFSEMAAEAAEDAGINPDTVRQANHTFKFMLGITSADDLTALPVKSTADAATADEQRLAAMLTAVSQMASSGGGGCSGDPGARARCVVELLSNATTSTTSFALSGGVANALRDALQVVLATPGLIGNVPPSVLAPVVAALDCAGAACTAPAPVAPLDTPGAIAATKGFLTEVRSDLVALFGDAQALQRGALEVEGNKFGAAMAGVRVPAEMALVDARALLLGVELFEDYTAGRRAAADTTSASDQAQCRVAQDAQGTTATSPADARFVQCLVNQTTDFARNAVYDHRIVIAPTATAGNWTYTATARETIFRFFPTLQTAVRTIGGAATGTLVTSFAGSRVTTFNADGKLPAAFRSSGEVASDSNEWTVRGARRFDVAQPEAASVTLAGTVLARSAAGTTLSTLQVKSASLSEVPFAGGARLGSAALEVLWTTPGAEFEGNLALTDPQADKSGVRLVPTRVTLDGRLANIESGVKTDFLQGRMSVLVTGFDAFDARSAASAGNFFTVNATFSGTVTAPGRPLLAVTLGTSWKAFEAAPRSATLEYRSFDGGTPRIAISAAATVDADGLTTLTLAEITSGVSLTARQGAASADVLLRGTTKIGVLDADSGILTFVDGSFVSAF